jgi:hypothetical protein
VATNAHKRVDEHLKQRIITTCGDANVLWGTKHIDPALCIYVGAYLMCIDNKHLKDKVPRGNGTLCKVLGVKLKHNAQSYRWKNYYGKKVWTVNANDVEWVECEHINKTGTIVQLEAQIHQLKCTLESLPKTNTTSIQQVQSDLQNLKRKLSTDLKERRFKLEPELFSTKVSVREFVGSKQKIQFNCRMRQIPANTNDATTGHKLQGMSKDVIIVTSWPTGFKNWEYVVLSRARTLSGLYLVKPIDMNKSFKPSIQLKKYIECARFQESILLKKREDAISAITWI